MQGEREIIELNDANSIEVIKDAMKAFDKSIKVAQIEPAKYGLPLEHFSGTYAIIYRGQKPGYRHMRYLMRYTNITKLG